MTKALPHTLQALRHRCSDRKRSAGLVVPIAVGGSLLLLLSSSSLQFLALQSRVQLVQQRKRLQLEDTLASAAQQQVAALVNQAPCLLTADAQQWSEVAGSCGLPSSTLAAMRTGQVGTQGYRLLSYRPAASLEAGGGSAELELQLTGQRPWRARYQLTLKPSLTGTLNVTVVQELGLAGARP